MAFTTIKFRRDVAANWTSVNPVLAAGEPGFETDTGKHKIGNGSDAYNDLPYAGSGGTADIHAGVATFASGETTVPADWVTTDTVIVALPQAAPVTPGTAIYADPADIVDATSFKIKSDDATDARAVYWITSAKDAAAGLDFPDTFYVSMRVRFNSGEGSAGGEIFSFNASDDFAGSKAFDLEIYQDGVPFYGVLATDFWASETTNYAEYTGLTIDADTWYIIDLKFEFSPDHKTQTVTVRLDGSVLGFNTSMSTAGFPLNSFILGGFNGGNLSAGGIVTDRDFDYLKIGSTDYDTDDLFSADFASAIVPPFDSVVGATTPAIVSGAMHVEDATASTYALRSPA